MISKGLMGGKRTAPESNSRVVCVAGMARAGTSMTMRLLNLLGLYLGPPDGLIPPGGGNPSGFWEHRKLLEINEAILARLGGSYAEPPSFPPGWARDPKLADLRREARATIREDFGEATLWGWKDPRNSLTLPFWQILLPDMRYVICLRNPLDVAASMEKFASFPFAASINLWLINTTGVIEHTAGKPRVLVFYEHFFEDWRAELRRLAEFVGAPVSPDAPEFQREVEAFIQGDLHRRCTVTEVMDAPELALTAKSLYLSLYGIVQGSRSRYVETIDRQELEEALNIFSTYARAEQAALQQKDALLAERCVLLAEKEAALAETGGQLRLVQQQYQVAISTIGFRLLQAYRRRIRQLFPPGSWRGRPYLALKSAIRRLLRRQ